MGEIVEVLGISHGSVVAILNEHLNKRKLSARWLPLQRVFGVDQPQCELVLASLHNRGLNMDSQQHTGDQAVVEAMGYSKIICSEEG